MGKIKAETLIREFQTMHAEHWSYVWGKAEKGTVDCSGAFVYAYRKHGLSIAHGSNAIARHYIAGKMLPVSKAEPGMAAFKFKEPGEGGWDLPDKYDRDPDQRDYYHIGLIDEDGAHVLNAQSEQAGFTRTDLSRWNAVAYLEGVDYAADDDQQEEHEMKKAIVTAQNGSTVNVRSAPSITAGKIIDRLPIGTMVDVLEDLGEWIHIRYVEKSGYMMSNFLEYASAPDETAVPDDLSVISEQLQDLEAKLHEIMATVAGLRDKGAI